VVIPVFDHNPVRRTPWVTYALVVLNIVVFLTEPIAMAPFGGVSTAQECRQDAYFREWGAVPKELVTNGPLPETVVGATDEACLVGAPDYDKRPVVSALTAMFLHGGWLHLLGNMLFLLVFGNNVEDRLGRVRFALWYVAWGLAATYLFALTVPGSTSVLVGASGAIAGVLGAYLVLFPRARVTSLVPFFFFLPARLPAWLVLGSWFLLQWVYDRGAGVTEGSDVAYMAHVAGFVIGFLVALRYRRFSPTRGAPRWG
jgi:membrane associated rhomboid family serine protease